MAVINPDQAADFLTQHQTVLAAALTAHLRRMSGAAAATRNAYDAIKDDPDKTAAQDQTVITTRGLQHAAGIFTDAADDARAALAALTHLQAGGEGHEDAHT